MATFTPYQHRWFRIKSSVFSLGLKIFAPYHNESGLNFHHLYKLEILIKNKNQNKILKSVRIKCQRN